LLGSRGRQRANYLAKLALAKLNVRTHACGSLIALAPVVEIDLGTKTSEVRIVLNIVLEVLVRGSLRHL
jgi:hypothetical protein